MIWWWYGTLIREIGTKTKYIFELQKSEWNRQSKYATEIDFFGPTSIKN